MAFGVTTTGFARKLLEDVLTELSDDQRASIHPNVNTSEASPHGQLNATFARQIAFAWEALEKAYDSFDPDKAEDDALTALCKLTGTDFRAATFSRVKADVTLTNGTTLLAGVHFAAVLDQETIRFSPEVDYTAPSTGTFSVWFKSSVAGVVRANAGTLTVIATPVTGWSAVTNAKDASVGNPEDTNDTLRARREQELAASGGATARAIRAAVLEVSDADGNKNVQQVTVVENDTDINGLFGLARHTIEVVVDDSPAMADTLIVQSIFDTKSAGIGTAGSINATALDDLGNAHSVFFSRPVDRPIWLAFALSYGVGYVGDAQFKTNVVAELNAKHGTGDDVFQWVCELAGRQDGVKNLNVLLGFGPGPTAELDLSILPREKARFDTSQIAVVAVPL